MPLPKKTGLEKGFFDTCFNSSLTPQHGSQTDAGDTLHLVNGGPEVLFGFLNSYFAFAAKSWPLAAATPVSRWSIFSSAGAGGAGGKLHPRPAASHASGQPEIFLENRGSWLSELLSLHIGTAPLANAGRSPPNSPLPPKSQS